MEIFKTIKAWLNKILGRLAKNQNQGIPAKKYRLTDETIEVDGHTLHRIECVTPFRSIKAGEKGGFIEREANLSQKGDCWVYYDAKVYGNAVVSNNAVIMNCATVFGYATVKHDAVVADCATVFDNARIISNATISENARVYDHAVVGGNAKVLGLVKIYDHAAIFGECILNGHAEVYDRAMVFEHARVYHSAKIYGDSHVGGSADVENYVEVYGCCLVTGDARLRGNAMVKDDSDYIVFKNHFSSGRFFTWTKSNNMWSVGCFYGTSAELVDKAYAESDKKGDFYKAYVDFVETLVKLEEKHRKTQRNNNER